MTQDITIRMNNHSTTRRVTFPIYGLGCGGGGALTIERALQRTAGVQYVYVNPAIEMAYVCVSGVFNPEKGDKQWGRIYG